MIDEDRIAAFKNLETKNDIAALLKTTIKKLDFFTRRISNKKQYYSFEIPKKSSGVREILAPCKGLDFYQKQLNEILQNIYNPKPSVKGFCLNKSILDNAKAHKNKKFILNIDIEDFFGSINFGRVRGLFLSKPFRFNTEVATILAQVCCHKDKLPQGTSTSPIISNFICWNLDNDLYQLAKRHKLKYTRYADDITFSTYQHRFPKAIAESDGYNLVELKEELTHIFEKNGFKINNKKTRLQHKYHRQEVTGLVVNEFPNVKREYIRQIRAILHDWKKNGYESASKTYFSKHATKKHKGDFAQVVRGKIEFVRKIKGDDSSVYLNLVNRTTGLEPQIYKIENPLVFLQKFYSDLENLICDGKKITPQKRGFILESFLVDLMKHFSIPVFDSFKRNEGAEQIDGGFQLDGFYYLVEAKWYKSAKSINNSHLYPFSMKVQGSGVQTLGVYISINGWSENVTKLLKKHNNVLLMNGEDIKQVLGGKITLNKLISEKIKHFNLYAEPYYKVP